MAASVPDLLCGTGLWIANNLIAGSIGGAAPEVVVAAGSPAIIARMLSGSRSS